MTREDTDPEAPERPVLKGAWLLFAPILAIGLLAMAAGMVAGAMDGGKTGAGFYVALGLAALLFVGTLWLVRRMLPAYVLPRSPRMRQGRLLLYVSGLMGVVIGATLVAVQGGRPQSLLAMLRGEESVPQAAAIVLSAGLVVSLLLSVRWHRLLDEHERAAYDFGAVVALYLYFAVSAAWWLLWRASLLPEPDGVIIFFAVMAAWLAGWLIRRFR